MGRPVMHFEIGCRNREQAGKFYADLFGWKTQEFGPVLMFDTGSKEGIQGHLNALGHEPHNYVTVYVQVDDLEKYLKSAERLGGKTVIEPQEVPDTGHFAWFSDPDGNVIGLWKPMKT